MLVGRHKQEIKERSKAIRQDFERRYNRDELREQLCREQEGICAICKKPMQDSCSVICVVDHAASIYIWAQSQISVEEACEYANARKNLVATHIPCNTIKREQDLEEFLDRIETDGIKFGEVLTLTEDQITELMDEQSERGRIAGRIGGRIGGRKAAENGRIQAIGRVYGPIYGLKNVENGRSQGSKNRENGHLDRIRLLPRFKEALRENKENGIGIFKAGIASSGGRTSCHRKWHINRGISKPYTCILCAASLELKAV
jgi:hypothetical protein